MTLAENYRSTPQVLELANNLLASTGREKHLVATRGDGPEPTVARHGTESAELAAISRWIRERIADGTTPAEIAVLVRMNAQLAPIEAELTRAGIAYQVRGVRFFDRPDVRGAIDLVRRASTAKGAGALTATGTALRAAIRSLWAEKLGYDDAGIEGRAGDEARERTAALDTLLDILATQQRADSGVHVDGYLAELERRRVAERAGSADGVNLLTYHRAKGLEWDAVALPALEEGLLPIRQAVDDDELLAEEGRLLYVGITRARVHLALSWAAERESRGKTTRRQPSRFLGDLRPRGATRVTQLPDRYEAGQTERRSRQLAADSGTSGVANDDPLFAALRAWRTARAREDGLPPYVVAHDQTLAAIAELKPSTSAALRRVRGIGPAKVDEYGAEILEIVARMR